MIDPLCLGIPVRFDEKLRLTHVADSRGLWRWKKIVIGPAFTMFTPREQQAILLHEAGHCKMWHLEKRVLNLWRWLRPSLMLELCVEQEYQADMFVAGCGYGNDLANAFERLRQPEIDPLHPSLQSRIDRLRGV